MLYIKTFDLDDDNDFHDYKKYVFAFLEHYFANRMSDFTPKASFERLEELYNESPPAYKVIIAKQMDIAKHLWLKYAEEWFDTGKR